MATFEDDLWDLAAVDSGRKFIARPNASHKQQLAKIHRKVAEWEYRISLAQPRFRQVQHLIVKFGGILPFAVACNRHPNHIIYKWLGVTKTGTVYKQRWGLLPSMNIMVRLMRVARSYGVLLKAEDLLPDLIEGDSIKNPYSHPELRAWAESVEASYGTSKESMQKLETEIAQLLGD